MGQFFGITFVLYIFSAAVLLPVLGVSAWWATRDCRLLSGEQCVWVVLPVSQAPEDQRPTPEDRP